MQTFKLLSIVLVSFAAVPAFGARLQIKPSDVLLEGNAGRLEIYESGVDNAPMCNLEPEKSYVEQATWRDGMTVEGVGVVSYTIKDGTFDRSVEALEGDLFFWMAPAPVLDAVLDRAAGQRVAASGGSTTVGSDAEYRRCLRIRFGSVDPNRTGTPESFCENLRPRSIPFSTDELRPASYRATILVVRNADGDRASVFCHEPMAGALPDLVPLNIRRVFDVRDASVKEAAAIDAVGTTQALSPTRRGSGDCANITARTQCLATFPPSRGGSSCGWIESEQRCD